MADAPRTMLASEGLRIGGMFMAKMASFRLGSQPVRVVRVSDPEVSTEGGKRARQNIVLHPESGEAATLVVGWMDVTNRTAELRGFDAVAEQFRARFGMPLDIEAEAYHKFLAAARGLLEGEGFEVTVVREAPKPPSPSPAASPPPASGRPGLGVWIAIAVAAVAGFVAAYLLFK